MVSAAQTSPRGTGGREGPPRLRYLISRLEGHRLEVLTLSARPRRETLPVFTGEGPARDFLCYAGGDWRVRESTAGELVSLLAGCLPHVDRIVFDPVFGISAEDAEPRSMTKGDFVAALMAERLAVPAR